MSIQAKIAMAALLIFAAGVLPACSAAPAGSGQAGSGQAGSGQAGGVNSGSDKATIMVTTNILGDITRNIVGDTADVVVLMEANADPHSFGVSAFQAGQMEQAELIVFNGLGLEEAVLNHVSSAEKQGVPVIEVGAAIEPLSHQSAAVGAGAGGTLDPHFWTDPQRILTAIAAIEEAVAQHVSIADPVALHSNAANYRAKVAELDAWMVTEFATVPAGRRKIVTNHHVFGYLADRFALEVVGAVMPSGTTLAAPSAADLSALATTIREAGVPAIFADTSQPERLAEVLAQEAKVAVEIVPLFTESLSAPGEGAESYLEMMRTNTTRMSTALTR
ncbi:zinc ABC transporter substrate-binding protein AztC [Arthrobacter sp. Sr24]